MPAIDLQMLQGEVIYLYVQPYMAGECECSAFVDDVAFTLLVHEYATEAGHCSDGLDNDADGYTDCDNGCGDC
jgi:hypothetical protein